jgi:hypothetical protein
MPRLISRLSRSLCQIHPPLVKYELSPPCVSCKYILLDQIDPLNITKIKCKKFAVRNKITGFIEYETANECRNNINKCSDIGFYYENMKL